MKNLSILLFLLLLPYYALAAEVSEQEALTIAYNFFNAPIVSNTGKKISRVQRNVRKVSNKSIGGQQLYIYNAENGNGYVIISADDCARPILGYSETGTIDENNIPTNFQYWLNEYNREISWAKTNGLVPSEEIQQEWNVLRTGQKRTQASITVPPLLKTEWSQDAWYNSLCPYDSQVGKYCLTGCVATAMAQIMKYWNHPKHGKGIAFYTDFVYGFQFADFENTYYAWDKMPNDLNIFSSSQNITAVAELMYHCGVSVEMNYGTDASGAHSWSVPDAVKNHFGYDERTSLISKNYVSPDKWELMILEELLEGRPVYYSGGGMRGGHAFVCDGYNGDHKFHINWGWDQGLDGYYALSALQATILLIPVSGDYSTNQQALFYMQPRKDTVDRYLLEINDTIILENTNPIILGDTVRFAAQIKNYGFIDYNGRIYTKLYDPNYDVTRIDSTDIITIRRNSWIEQSLITSIPHNCTAGHYHIEICYRDTVGEIVPINDTFYFNISFFDVIDTPLSNKEFYLVAKRATGNYFFLTPNKVSGKNRLVAINTGTAVRSEIDSISTTKTYIWTIEESTNGILLKSNNKQYLTCTAAKSATLSSSGTELFTRDNTDGSITFYYDVDESEKRFLSLANEGLDYFVFYANENQIDHIYLIKACSDSTTKLDIEAQEPQSKKILIGNELYIIIEGILYDVMGFKKNKIR